MDNRDRFTGKAENYAKYRPSYPEKLFLYLTEEMGIGKSCVAADIGAGTGIFTRLLSPYVGKIYAIEPNHGMRVILQKYCADKDNIESVDGDAEHTGLGNSSIDLITCAQAFHWFDRAKTKTEFSRIMKKNGKVVLVWNRKAFDNDFIRESEKIFKRLCPDFKGFAGGSEEKPESYNDFFRNGQCLYKVFQNNREEDLESFIGGSLSASYAPAENTGNYVIFIKELETLFQKYNKNGKLLIPNETHVYIGEM